MRVPSVDITGYGYQAAHLSHSHAYLLPTLKSLLDQLQSHLSRRRLFELGCGNGSVANYLAGLGWDVTGVDPSDEGIAQANKAYPNLKLLSGSAYDSLALKYGTYPVVLSFEVVEHVYSPRRYAQTVFDLLEPGGAAIISTPYHGYWKNLALAVTGKMDAHFTALWDHGHIKFWSIQTLTQLLEEAGFVDCYFHKVGRVPALAKSMIVIARRPV